MFHRICIFCVQLETTLPRILQLDTVITTYIFTVGAILHARQRHVRTGDRILRGFSGATVADNRTTHANEGRRRQELRHTQHTNTTMGRHGWRADSRRESFGIKL